MITGMITDTMTDIITDMITNTITDMVTALRFLCSSLASHSHLLVPVLPFRPSQRASLWNQGRLPWEDLLWDPVLSGLRCYAL